MNFGRMLTAMVTPFDKNLEVNYDMAAKLAEYLLEQGNDGIVVNGTTGESPTLNDDEKVQMFRTVKQTVGERAVVIAGTGSNNTHHSIELTQKAAECGVDGIMLVVPYYSKPSQEGLYQHFKTVAAATALPIILYNIPGRCGMNLAPETVVRLANDVPNIVAIKEASGDIGQVATLAALADGCLDIYSGNDDQVVPLLALGGKGVISVLSNVVPRETHDMVMKFLEGDVKGSLDIQLKYMDVIHNLFSEVNPIPAKRAVAEMGYCKNIVRRPLTEMEEDHAQVLIQSMKEAGIL